MGAKAKKMATKLGVSPVGKPATSRGKKRRDDKKLRGKNRQALVARELAKQQDDAKRSKAAPPLALGLGGALGTALPELDNDNGNGASKMARSHKRLAPSRRRGQSEKSRQATLKEEIEHVAEVLEHEAYQSNPFAALREHLTNTVAPPEATLDIPEAPAGKHGDASTGDGKKKRSESPKTAVEVKEAQSIAKRAVKRKTKRPSLGGGIGKPLRTKSTKSGKIGVKRPKI